MFILKWVKYSSRACKYLCCIWIDIKVIAYFHFSHKTTPWKWTCFYEMHATLSSWGLLCFLNCIFVCPSQMTGITWKNSVIIEQNRWKFVRLPFEDYRSWKLISRSWWEVQIYAKAPKLCLKYMRLFAGNHISCILPSSFFPSCYITSFASFSSIYPSMFC
jgi:hypothetical protein